MDPRIQIRIHPKMSWIRNTAFRDNTGAKFHLEALHFPTGGYDCRLCGKHLSTKNSLKCHMYQVHSREERLALKY